MNERLVVVDRDTMEIYGPAQAPKKKRMRHPYGFDWRIVSGGDYETALRSVIESRVDLAVFGILPRIMEKENVLRVTPQLLRTRLGLSLASCYRSLQRMRDHWIIGQVDGYTMFNPKIAWRGQWPEGLAVGIKRWDAAMAATIKERKDRQMREAGNGA